MQVPSIKKFNGWPLYAKTFWVDMETGGKFRQLKRSCGYFPVIIYKEDDVGIVYSVDDNCNLIEATAMPIAQALERLKRFINASETLAKASRLS